MRSSTTDGRWKRIVLKILKEVLKSLAYAGCATNSPVGLYLIWTAWADDEAEPQPDPVAAGSGLILPPGHPERFACEAPLSPEEVPLWADLTDPAGRTDGLPAKRGWRYTGRARPSRRSSI